MQRLECPGTRGASRWYPVACKRVSLKRYVVANGSRPASSRLSFSTDQRPSVSDVATAKWQNKDWYKVGGHGQVLIPPPRSPGLPTLDAVVVCEGKRDANIVRQAVSCPVLVVGGAGVSRERVLEVKAIAAVVPALVVLTDPDGYGRRYRVAVDVAIPGLWHAFVPVPDAVSWHATKYHERCNVGVEHASPAAVLRALQRARRRSDATADGASGPFSRELLIDWRLAQPGFNSVVEDYMKNATLRRTLLANHIGIAQLDGNAMWKGLNRYGFTLAEVVDALPAVERRLPHVLALSRALKAFEAAGTPPVEPDTFMYALQRCVMATLAAKKTTAPYDRAAAAAIAAAALEQWGYTPADDVLAAFAPVLEESLAEREWQTAAPRAAAGPSQSVPQQRPSVRDDFLELTAGDRNIISGRDARRHSLRLGRTARDGGGDMPPPARVDGRGEAPDEAGFAARAWSGGRGGEFATAQVPATASSHSDSLLSAWNTSAVPVPSRSDQNPASWLPVARHDGDARGPAWGAARTAARDAAGASAMGQLTRAGALLDGPVSAAAREGWLSGGGWEVVHTDASDDEDDSLMPGPPQSHAPNLALLRSIPDAAADGSGLPPSLGAHVFASCSAPDGRRADQQHGASRQQQHPQPAAVRRGPARPSGANRDDLNGTAGGAGRGTTSAQRLGARQDLLPSAARGRDRVPPAKGPGSSSEHKAAGGGPRGNLSGGAARETESGRELGSAPGRHLGIRRAPRSDRRTSIER